MMVERAIPYSGPEDAVRPALEKAGQEFGGMVAAQRDGWRLSGGTWLATNPNSTLWSVRVTAAPGSIVLRGEPAFFPWTRNKVARIVAVRLEQLADVVAGHLGSGPAKSPTPAELAPWSGPSSAADLCRALAANAASTLAAMAAIFGVLVIVCLQLVEQSLPELLGRSLVLERAGYPAQPSPRELASIGAGLRLASAALLAGPMAFFLGLVHGAVHVGGELWRPLSRLAPWSALFLLLVGLFGFASILPLWTAVPCALLLPIAANAGSTLVWGRRTEFLRAAAPAGHRWTAATLACLALLLALTLPIFGRSRSTLDEIALFRDRFLLPTGPGRALASLYYRTTGYASDPLRELHGDPTEAASFTKLLRTALLAGRHLHAAQLVRRFGYVVEVAPDPEQARTLLRERRHDVYLLAEGSKPLWDEIRTLGMEGRVLYVGAAPADGLQVDDPNEPRSWERALSEASRRTFHAGVLRALSAEGWRAVYWAGPPFVLALVLGALLGLAAPLLRRVGPRDYLVLMSLIMTIAAGGALISLGSGRGLRDGGGSPAERAQRLLKGLDHPSPSVRHEAAWRLFFALEEPDYPRELCADGLARAIADPDLRVRLWAAAAAGRTKQPSVRPALLKAMEDPELFVRYRAAEGLGWLEAGREKEADRAALQSLEKMARGGSWYEGLYALSALKRIDPSRW